MGVARWSEMLKLIYFVRVVVAAVFKQLSASFLWTDCNLSLNLLTYACHPRG